MRTVYKVVHRTFNDKLVSAQAGYNIHTKDLEIKYTPGELAVPTIGKLFAFEEQWCAADFTGDLVRPTQVWEAETTHCQRTDRETRIPSLVTSMRNIMGFWETGDNEGTTWPVPVGTVLCDDITLVRRIDGSIN